MGQAPACITFPVRSYLSNRKQCVSFNNFLSAECTNTTFHRRSAFHVPQGVPQGSILGPLLFSLYIKDICNSSSLLYIILYADDTNIFFSSKNIDDSCTIVNMELRCVMQWFICKASITAPDWLKTQHN